MLELAEESVTLAPLAVTLPFWLWLFPTVRVPKLIDPGVTPSVPVEVVAVPERETATLGSDAFELRVRVALSVPAAVGANFTDKFALLPAPKTYGKDNPLTLKLVLLTAAAEMVRLDPPEFERVSACVLLVPTRMLPRFMLDGELR